MRIIIWSFLLFLPITSVLAEGYDEVTKYVLGLYECIDDIVLSEPCPKNVFSFVESLPDKIAHKIQLFLQHYLHHDYFKGRCELFPLEVIATIDQVSNIVVQDNDMFIVLSDCHKHLCKEGELSPVVCSCMNESTGSLQLLPTCIVAGLSCGDLAFYEEGNNWQVACCQHSITSLSPTLDKFLIAGSSVGEICIIDSYSKKIVSSILGHSGAVTGMVNTLDGNIISSSLDGTVKRWSRKKGISGEIIYYSKSPITYITQLDDSRLVVCLQSGQIELIDQDTGMLLNILSGHTAAVTAATITIQGNIVTASKDRTIKIWSPTINTSIFSFDVQDDDIYALAVNHDGNIISGSSDKTVKVWSCKDLNPFGITNLLQLFLLIKIELDMQIYKKKKFLLSDDWYTVFQTLPRQFQEYYIKIFDEGFALGTF